MAGQNPVQRPAPAAASAATMADAVGYLATAGEVGRCLLAQDGRGSALGPIANWPRQLHQTLRLALHSGFPYIVYWGEALHTFWNDAARHFFQGQHPQDLGRPLAEVQPDVMPVLHPLLRQVLTSGQAMVCNDIQLLYWRADYVEEIHEVFSYSPVLDEDGRVRGVMAPIFDATARVLSARRMAMLADLAASTRSARSRADYQQALTACLRRHPHDLPQFALYLAAGDGAGPVLACSSAEAESEAGAWPPQPRRRPDSDLDPGEASALWAALRGPARLTLLTAEALGAAAPGLPVGGPWQRPGEQLALVPIPAGGGERRRGWLLVALNPHKRLDADYQTFLTLVAAQIGQGLSDSLALEQAADRALAEISRLTRLGTMGELATSIAHEVNQPLTAMVLDAHACLRWLSQPPGPGSTQAQEEARAAARRIAASGAHAGQVLARIRGFLQRGPAQRVPLALAPLAWDSLQLVAAQARRHGIRLRVRLAPDLPPLLGDRTQLQQVLLNLLVNAVDALQAQAAGQPRQIRLQLQPGAVAPDGTASVRVSISDNGPGIAAAQREHLFEAFQSSKPQGLGVGLSIARSIIEAHGGRIGAEAGDVGGGSCFWFELPGLAATAR